VPLHISRVDNQVCFQDVITLGGVNATTGDGGSAQAIATAQSEQFQTLTISMHQLDCQQVETIYSYNHN
jgi:hypothetical protein